MAKQKIIDYSKPPNPTTLRLTWEEKDLLEQIAKINHRSIPKTVQVWIAEEAKKLKLSPSRAAQ